MTTDQQNPSALPAASAPAPSWGQRFWRFPLTRIVLAVFITALSVGLTMSFFSSLAGETKRIMWPELLGAAAALVSYYAYVRLFEKRPVAELSRAKALRELGGGLLLGVLLVAAVIGLLALAGSYRLTGVNGWSVALLVPLAEMILVGVFEEVLCRGIVFRITEGSLGSWLALTISSLIFGLAHAPSAQSSPLAIAIAVVAGAFFAAAYMMTRRLWLCIGIHVAWNYTLGTICSVAVSGRESRGLLQGELSGREWLTGGAYGLEASVLTLLLLTAVGVVFLSKARARGHIVAPSWPGLRRG
ncbi:CPBP family intramembrane glutamic endopeptidase [Polyangium aurulentum]|uniref:CPBP family intramembrane glutamic endopeptidase n=1 Tax=Polyangium aurulentum TaxID=2567896 RepID=UPI0010AE0CED|nr:CPBP family intramembrane glutamic endopeptidase [Polyangium aurulentum]UQA59910.1 CPBP family intramembrane metalloprotease [Polyangium aurulentum]